MTTKDSDQQYLGKLCIFGDGGVGKTTLVQKYLTGLFTPDTRLTVGVDFHVKKLKIDDISVTLQIWDFAGEDRFRFLLPSYLRGANGGIFMYDITRFTSLKNMSAWMDALKKNPVFNDLPLFLVGGKADLAHKRSIETDYGKEIAIERGFKGFAECSAKTGANVELIFEAITKIMLKNAGML
ncbi:MAG: Rab family GTPase [Promethearchaeota archaeon]